MTTSERGRGKTLSVPVPIELIDKLADRQLALAVVARLKDLDDSHRVALFEATAEALESPLAHLGNLTTEVGRWDEQEMDQRAGPASRRQLEQLRQMQGLLGKLLENLDKQLEKLAEHVPPS
ncbi:MAG TPA: hypothetical protein VLV83_19125, partial [Acidobacteriota bacterium]|nr:hypothetical protein [Acidobacteriota bacterium]